MTGHVLLKALVEWRPAGVETGVEYLKLAFERSVDERLSSVDPSSGARQPSLPRLALPGQKSLPRHGLLLGGGTEEGHRLVELGGLLFGEADLGLGGVGGVRGGRLLRCRLQPGDQVAHPNQRKNATNTSVPNSDGRRRTDPRRFRLEARQYGVNIDTIDMAKVESILDDMSKNPAGISFSDACKVADHYFGSPRQDGTSHKVWKMPWAGNPRVNLQKNKEGKAKPYQVRQLLDAIDRLEDTKKTDDSTEK